MSRAVSWGTARSTHASAWTVILVAGCVSLGKPRLVAELESSRDYQGVAQSLAFDGSEARLATRSALYELEDGKPRLLDSVVARGDQISLAPNGRLYARQHALGPGLNSIELYEIPKKLIGELRIQNSAAGFGGIYFGGAGGLILTARALDNLEGLGGRFQYAFWSSNGQYLAETTLEGPRAVVMDPVGEATVLLGPKDAIAFTKTGKQLWKLDGAFRDAALAGKGLVALLNPVFDSARPGAIDEVHVFRDGKVTIVAAPGPVYDLALDADGSAGAVASKGELRFISPEQCTPTACELKRSRALSVTGTFLITEIRFINRSALAVGVIQREGDQEPYKFPAGAVVVVQVPSGDPLYNKSIELEQPATWAPMLDVTYGARTFGAHTPHRALVVRF